jgi:hypothetical protein
MTTIFIFKNKLCKYDSFFLKQFKIVNNCVYKLSEDISKSAFFMNLKKISVFPTYHVIEAKKP